MGLQLPTVSAVCFSQLLVLFLWDFPPCEFPMEPEPTRTQTLVIPEAESAFPGSGWSVVSERRPPTSPTTVRTNISSSNASEADDLVFHFKQMRLPDYKQWSRKFFSAGYRDMEELRDADLTEVFGELQIPSGIQTILQKGVSEFKAGTFAAAFPMPREDLDATAPRQADSEWGWGWIVLGAGVAIVTVASGAALLSAAPAAAEGVAAAATAEAAATTATVSSGFATGSLVMTGLGMLALGDCLDGDTKITMSDRSQKKIQDLNAGDQILTFNKGKTKVKTILKAPLSLTEIRCKP